MAEFHDPTALLAAAQKATDSGYTKLDAYTPFPIHGLNEAVGFKKTWLSTIVLCGGIAGALGGFGMQYFASVIHYPLNIGGRPLNSWPAFIPITFEVTVLLAAFSAVVGMIMLNGLPLPYHPVFNVKSFQFASRDQFFLCIESEDPLFELGETRRFLQSLNPIEVNDVPW
ncbi:MAG: DUF3341 domain-containing protein [Acidobacteria bacterium]|nr:DUF3341 domain-containing protein [Acidobacteriota bacterium]